MGLPISPNGGSVSGRMSMQPTLYPSRITTIYPGGVNGADIKFLCEADQGGPYYCKSDKDGRLIRATEWLCTHLAAHLNIATADCAIIEDPQSGETYFGSRQIPSLASDTDLDAFLNTPQLGELGQPSEWPGAYLSQLYTLDLFFNNPDRGVVNMLLQQEGYARRLCAIDFAAANVASWTGRKFPVESSTTVWVGRWLHRLHRFYPRTAFEMIDRIAAVPAETIAGFLSKMPDDWMLAEQREGICELWSGKKSIGGRLTALRTGLADESLL